MVVTHWPNMHAKYEGLARTLKVYDAGWVSGFNDVRNGDTGTLLAEVTTPVDAVAIRIHRNGGIAIMGRSAVKLASSNGAQDGQEQVEKVEDAKLTSPRWSPFVVEEAMDRRGSKETNWSKLSPISTAAGSSWSRQVSGSSWSSDSTYDGAWDDLIWSSELRWASERRE